MKSQISIEFLVAISLIAITIGGLFVFSEKFKIPEKTIKEAELLGKIHTIESGKQLGTPFKFSVENNKGEYYETYSRIKKPSLN